MCSLRRDLRVCEGKGGSKNAFKLLLWFRRVAGSSTLHVLTVKEERRQGGAGGCRAVGERQDAPAPHSHPSPLQVLGESRAQPPLVFPPPGVVGGAGGAAAEDLIVVGAVGDDGGGAGGVEGKRGHFPTLRCR